MLGKVLIAAAGGAIGYVLGAKAGRERYGQIKGQASRIWHDPRVQDKASQAADTVKDGASQAADKAKDSATQAVNQAADKAPSVKQGGTAEQSSSSEDELTPPEAGTGAEGADGGRNGSVT